jgi:hypothetical protein
MKPRTLHAGLPAGWGYVFWLEHGVDFEFTGRIKYLHENGDFKTMYLEIQYEGKERRWYTFWKQTPAIYFQWVRFDNFEDKHPHKDLLEETIVECN